MWGLGYGLEDREVVFGIPAGKILQLSADP
jgi:hypothetical protein